MSVAPAELVVSTEHWRGWMLVPVLVSMGFVVAIVSSLGSPMVPTVAEEYGVSLAQAQWTLTIALLAAGTMTPIFGRLGDGRHRRGAVLGALGIVAFGCLLATIRGPFALLLVARAAQGVGLGLMPLAMSVARDHLAMHRVAPTVAVLSISAAAGVGLGYPMSGLLADTVGYHRTFLVAAAMTAIVWVGGALTIPTSVHRRGRTLDLAGAALLGVGVATLVVALSETTAWGATSARFLGVLAAGVVVLGAWVAHQLSTREPLVNLRTVRHPSVAAAQATALLAAVGMYFLIALFVRYVQTPSETGYGRGFSVLMTGLLLVPFSVASLAVNRLLPVLRRWMPEDWLLPAGCFAFAASLVVFASSRTSTWQFVVVMALAGVGVGTAFASMPVLIVRAVSPEETGSTLGFNQLLRSVGSSIGSAISATVLAAYTTGGARFPSDAGYTTAALVGVGVWLAAAAVSWPRGARRAAGVTGALAVADA